MQELGMFSPNILCRIHLQSLQAGSQVVHSQIVSKWQRNAGISRCLCINKDTVTAALKKENLIRNVNKEYFQTRSNGKIRVEMDEM